MTIELSFFIFSLFGMIGMLTLKNFELKTGKSILSRVSTPTDSILRKKINTIRAFLILFNRQNAKRVLALILHVCHQAYLYLHKKWQEKYRELSGTVRTRKDFKVNKNSVSFFLKDVLEYKSKLNREH